MTAAAGKTFPIPSGTGAGDFSRVQRSGTGEQNGFYERDLPGSEWKLVLSAVDSTVKMKKESITMKKLTKLLAMLLAGVLYVPMKRYFAGSDILK